MFVIGFIVGLIVGANISLIFYACIIAGRRADEHIDKFTSK